MIAPARARRPGARALDEGESEATCSFCEGREAATPPEVFALGPPERRADSPGWSIRVVPNLYPAFERQEVVIHVPRHARSLAELSDEELERVAGAWRARAAAAREAGFAYVHALVNEGRAAGASLPHSHSQLVWLRAEPPLVTEERAREESEGGCLLCRLLAEEREHRTRVVSEAEGVILLCPFAGRQPYEMLVAPLRCEDGAFTSPSLSAGLSLAAEGVRRLRSVEPKAPLNLWLHATGHWHLELVPRLNVLAGIELGAGYYVNTLAPEAAADALRAARPPVV